MASRFRLNQYNWFGQKLLVQHRYNEIIQLKQSLDHRFEGVSCLCSDHMIYVQSIALTKTSARLGDVIYMLQRLNFTENNQYFLLLCQCLLYSGNYDSAAALCRQVINKEIDSVSGNTTSDHEDSTEEKPDDVKRNQFNSLACESSEFKRLFSSINRNNLINDPRLWFIFGISLEFQRQFRDAELAFKLATKLCSEFGRNPGENNQANDGRAQPVSCISNHFGPYVKYAQYFMKHKANPKLAMRVLGEVGRLMARNHVLGPFQALVTCAQPRSSRTNFTQAFEILSSLETHFVSNRNPASVYNNLALKCTRQSAAESPWLTSGTSLLAGVMDIGDEHRLNLAYLLARSHILINSLVQDSDRSTDMYNVSSGAHQAKSQVARMSQIDKLIELLRSADPLCWSSAALWNNLGVCYLMKRRYIAALSCLAVAMRLNPLDWRLNYNIALTQIHVGLASRALVNLKGADSRYRMNWDSAEAHRVSEGLPDCRTRTDPFIATLMAICLDILLEKSQARQLYVEAIKVRRSGPSAVPILSVINYLVYLHQNLAAHDDETAKLKSRLLDHLEHMWLQRDQNDPQFNEHLMELARKIGEETSRSRPQLNRKTYAWNKVAEAR